MVVLGSCVTASCQFSQSRAKDDSDSLDVFRVPSYCNGGPWNGMRTVDGVQRAERVDDHAMV